ncbi:MAG TPA: hypothetical protein VMT67_14355 [Terriglobales bacterium]|nr:hypothetical protein [Terriglobales bacterium]
MKDKPIPVPVPGGGDPKVRAIQEEQKRTVAKKENHPFSEQEKHGEQAQRRPPLNEQERKGASVQPHSSEQQPPREKTRKTA